MFKQPGVSSQRLFSAALSIGMTTMLLSMGAMATSAEDAMGGRFGKVADEPAAVVERFAPYDDTKDAQQEFELANQALNKAVTGKQSQEVSSEEIARVITQAERAAGHGSAAAYNLLYTIYFSGWGVPVDNNKAIEYLKRAATMGDIGARLNYAVLSYQGTPEVTQDLNRACGEFKDLIADPRVAAVASYFMGMLEFRGDCGRPANEAYGMELMQVAATHGVSEAELTVAMNYEYGWTVPANLRTALDWYEKAATDGQPRAVWRLGVACQKGERRDRDLFKAIEYFQQAARAGDANGFASLASILLAGDGVEKDAAKAKLFFEQAAALGNAQANIELAKMYLQGDDLPADVVQSRMLYTRAIEMGAKEEPALLQAIEAKMTPEQLQKARVLMAKVAVER